MAAKNPTLTDAAIQTDAVELAAHDPGPIGKVTALWGRISKLHFVAHLIRMFLRFTDRLGTQFAAAITYFSFLSLVPLMMVGFATAGFVLANQPDLIQSLKDEVNKIFAAGGGEMATNLSSLIDRVIADRFAVGGVALAIALYTGIGWMGNLRQAIRAQWRPKWEQDPSEIENFFVALAKDLLSLVVLGLGIIVSVALTAISASATTLVAGWFGLDDVTWVMTVLRIVPIVLAIVASTGIFYFLYSYLPRPKGLAPKRTILAGSIIAATVFEILKLALSLLFRLFSGSPTAAVFGSVIALLLFMNVVAQVVLMLAAWIATKVPVEDTMPEELAVVIRPEYRVRSLPAVAGALGAGAAVGWLARTLRPRRR